MVAQDERILTNRSQVHVLVRQFTAHHAGIRFDGDHVQSATAVYVEICLVMVAVLPIQSIPIGIQAVAVFHGELAHADQSGARSGVIPPLGLDVIDQSRQLLVGLDFAPHQVSHNFFMGHRQHHIVIVLVLETPHLGADLVPAPGLLPQVGGMDNRHADLLPADLVHLIPQDGFDLHHRAPGKVQVREDACPERSDESSAHEQLVADNFRLGGGLPQGLTKKLRKLHEGPLKAHFYENCPFRAGSWVSVSGWNAQAYAKTSIFTDFIGFVFPCTNRRTFSTVSPAKISSPQ